MRRTSTFLMMLAIAATGCSGGSVGDMQTLPTPGEAPAQAAVPPPPPARETSAYVVFPRDQMRVRCPSVDMSPSRAATPVRMYSDTSSPLTRYIT